MCPDEKKESAGRKGGIARRNALTHEERKAIAQRGAAAKWNKPLIATNKGNFLEHLGVDVDCYVLNDAVRTPVISQIGMATVIGLSSRGNALPRFLASKAMSKFVGAELAEKLRNPFKFQWGSGGAEQPPGEINGFDAANLIDLCKAIIEANAKEQLAPQQRHIAANASVVISASAKSGIRDFVYAVAGFDQTADQIIQAFKIYVQEEAKKYEKEFPKELYEAWQRLYQIPPMARGKPWEFMHLTVNHIYVPLANSNGRLLDLLRALRSQHGDRQKKLFQFLNDVGARALRLQIGRVWEMAESSDSRAEYDAKIVVRFGGQQEFNFSPPTSS